MQALLNMAPDHQDSHHSGFGQPGWMNVPSGYSASPQTSMSPMHEFPPFDYHAGTPVPLEPAYNMPRASPFATSHAPMPPALIVPQHVLWPSMLANQPQGAYQTPIMPAGPLQTPLSASTASDITPTSAKQTPSRRKLTDEERRLMCVEAEQNPTMKQTQIGAKFNVERSTVSKILRQREKYMNPKPKEESSSPEKKSKAKLPDFEKTLTNWVKNQQKKGVPITDEDLRKQIQVFSFSRDDQAVVSSATWLERFKRRTHLLTHRNNVDSSLLDPRTDIHGETPVEVSPDSSDDLLSPPMSAIDEMGNDSSIKLEGQDFFDFDAGKDSFNDSPMSNDGLGQLTSETALSPLSTGSGRADPNGILQLGEEGMIEDITEASHRQRSQTFSHAPLGHTSSPPASAGRRTPSLPVRSLTTANYEQRPAAIDPRQMMKRHKSVPDIHYPEQPRFTSMQPPPLPRSADTSPVGHAASPAEDDLIRALHEIKSLLEQNPSVAEPDDYLVIGKLMLKLKLLRPANGPLLPGGMHAIETMDSPRISKKRTILGISS